MAWWDWNGLKGKRERWLLRGSENIGLANYLTTWIVGYG